MRTRRTETVLNEKRAPLSRAERDVFDALLEVWPSTMTIEQLATAIGHPLTSPEFSPLLERLTGVCLVEHDGPAFYAADDLGRLP